jgi:hypothetical protein
MRKIVSVPEIYPTGKSHMITDTTFFTNEPGYALLDRFKKTLKRVQYFDVLVGYFRTSGFHQLCETLESIKT